MKKKPLVSISISTLNSAKTITKTFESLKKQTYKRIEVLIGDGGSTDDTVKIAKKYHAVICYGKELGRARFAVLKKAKGKYLMTLDSDQWIGKTLIARAVKKMEEGKYDGLIVDEKSVIGKGTFIEKLLAYDKWVVVSSRDNNPTFGAEIPRMYKRKDMLHFTWPKTLSILDDAVLYQKNRLKIKRVARLEGEGIKHKEVDSFRVFFKKFMRYGKLYGNTFKVSTQTTIGHSLPRRDYFRPTVLRRPGVFFGGMLLYMLKAIAMASGIVFYKIHSD